ncbi:tetratricopeptide repeat family protein [Carpediemonas membranifera]|uniref:Tetratricopeptide repeat protein 29 n=1 Tax=Carpediemonas membranifera TaxID=201153 RepID=A0A8J6DZY5_9EUKA|nr:tetratricopeptide repeat family protein [Carpediemonas membranifera]|eukprot:KAG9391061.1 tetratricopeptide repeat family protein [Carpediemonas membranifera]
MQQRIDLCSSIFRAGCIDGFIEFFHLIHDEQPAYKLQRPAQYCDTTTLGLPEDELSQIRDLFIKIDTASTKGRTGDMFEACSTLSSLFLQHPVLATPFAPESTTHFCAPLDTDTEEEIASFRPPLALYYADRAVQIAERSNDIVIRAVAHFRMGTTLETLGRLRLACEAFEQFQANGEEALSTGNTTSVDGTHRIARADLNDCNAHLIHTYLTYGAQLSEGKVPRKFVMMSERSEEADDDSLGTQAEAAGINPTNPGVTATPSINTMKQYDGMMTTGPGVATRSGTEDADRVLLPIMQRALSLAQGLALKQEEGQCLHVLGVTYRRLGMPRKAARHLTAFLSIANACNDIHAEGTALGELSSLFRGIADIDTAVVHLQRFYELTHDTAEHKEAEKDEKGPQDVPEEGIAPPTIGVTVTRKDDPLTTDDLRTDSAMPPPASKSTAHSRQAAGQMGELLSSIGQFDQSVQFFEENYVCAVTAKAESAAPADEEDLAPKNIDVARIKLGIARGSASVVEAMERITRGEDMGDWLESRQLEMSSVMGKTKGSV